MQLLYNRSLSPYHLLYSPLLLFLVLQKLPNNTEALKGKAICLIRESKVFLPLFLLIHSILRPWRSSRWFLKTCFWNVPIAYIKWSKYFHLIVPAFLLVRWGGRPLKESNRSTLPVVIGSDPLQTRKIWRVSDHLRAV